MKPYYSEKGIEIYHGDCRELLPSLGPVDLVLTDPPYGIGYSPGGGGKGWAPNSKSYTGNDVVLGDDIPFDPAFLFRFERLILWGGNHYASRLPDSPTWLVWYKRYDVDGQPLGLDFADCELAWSNIGGPARVFAHRWNGLLRDSERGIHYHPTQKALALMKWCLGMVPEAETVLDPFMGSGTTLRAAKDLGRKAIGIEIEEKYAEIAAKRLQQEVIPFEDVPVQRPETQSSLLERMVREEPTVKTATMFDMHQTIQAKGNAKKVR